MDENISQKNKKSKLARLGVGVYYLFLVCITAIALLLVISAFPVTGNIKTMTVLSGSMEPSIHVGSMIISRPADSYKVGDVITFGKDTKTQIPTTHRIAEIKTLNGEIVYKTKGDANNAEDVREVSQKEILGKVYFSIPYLGYIINFVKKPMGLFLIIIIPAMIIIYEELKKVWREIKNLGKKKKEGERVAGANVLDLRDVKKAISPEKKENGWGLTAWFVVVMMIFNLGFAFSSYTSSYFDDTETSLGNTITVGTWGEESGELEGCSLGFWKNHTDDGVWGATGYNPNDLFSAVFEDVFPDMTLLEVLSQNGGGLEALGRQAVAGLLNSTHPEINYGMEPKSEVINAFNELFPAPPKAKNSYWDGLKDKLEAFNTAGCNIDVPDESSIDKSSVNNVNIEINVPQDPEVLGAEVSTTPVQADPTTSIDSVQASSPQAEVLPENTEPEVIIEKTEPAVTAETEENIDTTIPAEEPAQ